MVGILVHGNNHFILSGPAPDEATALALARHWSIIQIGQAKSSFFGQWQIRSKESRENLEWAVNRINLAQFGKNLKTQVEALTDFSKSDCCSDILE
jgi:hypothetical protein